jgi:ABC-type Zn uptake system ZnuABC Zn-binding protein ZnuA
VTKTYVRVQGKLLKHLIYLLSPLCLALACSTTDTPESRARAERHTLNIMTTVLPMQNLTLAVTRGATNVSVRQLVPSAAGCPHDYILQPGDLKALENSQLLVGVGLGYEPFLDKISDNYNNRLTIARIGEGVEVIGANASAEHNGHGERERGEHRQDDATGAEHPFASPKQAATMAFNLAAALAARDRTNSALYRANAARLKDELFAIHGDLTRFVAGLANKRVAIASTVLAYLVRDIGFVQAEVLSGGEHRELSAGQIAQIIARLKKTTPAAILIDKSLDPRVVQMIANETGAKTISLEVGLSGATSPDAFVATLRQMAADLKAGLAPRSLELRPER